MNKFWDYFVESLVCGIIFLIISMIGLLIYLVSSEIFWFILAIALVGTMVALIRSWVYDREVKGYWWWEKWRKKKND
jgi:hypothetical protein